MFVENDLKIKELTENHKRALEREQEAQSQVKSMEETLKKVREQMNAEQLNIKEEMEKRNREFKESLEGESANTFKRLTMQIKNAEDMKE